MAIADEDDIGKEPRTMNNSYIISAIPYLPKSLAAICLVLNIVLPGSGDVSKLTRPVMRYTGCGKNVPFLGNDLMFLCEIFCN